MVIGRTSVGAPEVVRGGLLRVVRVGVFGVARGVRGAVKTRVWFCISPPPLRVVEVAGGVGFGRGCWARVLWRCAGFTGRSRVTVRSRVMVREREPDEASRERVASRLRVTWRLFDREVLLLLRDEETSRLRVTCRSFERDVPRLLLLRDALLLPRDVERLLLLLRERVAERLLLLLLLRERDAERELCWERLDERDADDLD